METKRKIRNAIMALMLAITSFAFTSCEAKFGGELTVGYIIGCIICAAVGFFAWLIFMAVNDAEENIGACVVTAILALILEILPFLWHPIPKFNLILLIVNIGQTILITVIWKDAVSKREAREYYERRKRENKEAEEREAKKAKERAEREAKMAAEKAAKLKRRNAEISKLETELAAKQQELAALGTDAMAIIKKAKLNNEIKNLETKIAATKAI